MELLKHLLFQALFQKILEDADRNCIMGAFCCCLCPEDFEEHAHTSNPIYRQCICLRYFFHQLLNGYGAMFQRLDGRSVPSQIQTATSSTSTTAGNTYDNSLCESHHLVPRPPPYEADPRYAREGLISRREKSMSHIQEDLQTLRRNGSSSAVETLAAVRKRIAETEAGQKLTHAESEKNLAAKTRDTGFVFTTSEDEDVCPTCLEEYSSENPKIVAKCSHHFHLSCIYEWMERSDSCPVCGKEMEFCESP
ncbi:E3 ubiquitin-protein ligase At3g02290-like isoform X1 [Musa acuminata AAA Group]